MIELTIRSVNRDVAGLRLFELCREDGADLPAFSAGAHIGLQLPNGMERQYSLLNDPEERNRYLIAVAKEPQGRGGSAFLHDEAHEGQRLMVKEPVNNFPLKEDAPYSVLIAAGIGVTPLWSMAQRLKALSRPFSLHYGARRRDTAALARDLAHLEVLRPGSVRLYLSREEPPERMNLAKIVQEAPPLAHFYCCGPAPVIDAFLAAVTHIPSDQIHIERFSAAEAKADAGGFTLVMARSGREILVPRGQTILDALKANRIRASYSCSEGVCGTCETRVIEGVPDHRDAVLTPEERQANQSMMICCSGSKTPRLVLDL